MDKNIVTDLIMESSFIDRIKARIGEDKERYSEDVYGDVRVCRLSLEDAVEKYGRGRYVTVYSPKLYVLGGREQKKLSMIVSHEISALIKKNIKGVLNYKKSILVVGLGNRGITPDAIGPLTAEKINVTRHIKRLSPSEFEKMGVCQIASVACGVMGDTGMDTLEIVKGVVDNIKPDVVIAVDALATRECQTLGAAIQLSDVGITPGAGIGNRQSGLNMETLGVPVIAIGVPTVVSALTLVCDLLSKESVDRDFSKVQKNFFVCPKECDILCNVSSDILSDAINGALSVI